MIDRKNKSGCKMISSYFHMFVILVLSSIVSAVEEESITINKPVIGAKLQPWVRFSTEYVRCFCNLPACVSTGYMCKSSVGGCFSDLLDHSGIQLGTYRGRHGCAELLRENQRSWCDENPDMARPPKRNRKHPKSLLVCCHHDMCNHVDSPRTKDLINNTLLDETLTDNVNRQPGNIREPSLYSNSEVWFRAATIAVPICGAVILFVLIALAVKILRNETENSHKLGATMYVHQIQPQNKTSCEKYNETFDRSYDNILRKQYMPTHHQNIYYPHHSGELQQQIQVPLLVQNEINTHHCGNKNETNAKLNLMQCDYIESGKNLMLEIEKDESPQCSEVNLARNINSDNRDDKFVKGRQF